MAHRSRQGVSDRTFPLPLRPGEGTATPGVPEIGKPPLDMLMKGDSILSCRGPRLLSLAGFHGGQEAETGKVGCWDRSAKAAFSHFPFEGEMVATKEPYPFGNEGGDAGTGHNFCLPSQGFSNPSVVEDKKKEPER
jgi:hypothetical protein